MADKAYYDRRCSQLAKDKSRLVDKIVKLQRRNTKLVEALCDLVDGVELADPGVYDIADAKVLLAAEGE